MQYGMQTGMRPWYMNATSPYFSNSSMYPWGNDWGQSGQQQPAQQQPAGQQSMASMYSPQQSLMSMYYPQQSLMSMYYPQQSQMYPQQSNPYGGVYGGLFGTNPMFGSLPNPYQFGYGLRKTDGSWAGPYGQLPGVQKGQQQPEAPAAAETPSMYSPWKDAPTRQGEGWGDRVGNYVWIKEQDLNPAYQWDRKTQYDPRTYNNAGSGTSADQARALLYNYYIESDDNSIIPALMRNSARWGDDLSKGTWAYDGTNPLNASGVW